MIKVRSLAFKLYALLLAAVVAIIALAYAGSHAARVTADAAVHLSRSGLDGIVKAGELEVLIEQHRRIIEAAPAEVDRRQIAQSRTALKSIEASITALSAAKDGDAARTVAAMMPELVAAADRVIFFAENLAHDSAADAVDDYLKSAVQVQDAIRQVRVRQQDAADSMVASLVANARNLVGWGTSAVVIAMAVLAPLGVLVLGNAARRLRALWRAMHRIARNDIAYAVPSLNDVDEIGDMARAVQVFQNNAATLQQQRGEIEQVNRYLDIALNNMARGLSMFDASHRLVLCNDSYRALYDLPALLTTPGTAWSDIANHRSDRLVGVDIHPTQGPLIRSSATFSPRGEGSPAAPLVSDRAGEEAFALAATDLRDLGRHVVEHRQLQFQQSLADGRIIAVAVRALDDGGWVAVHEDVTQQRMSEAHITRLARHDTLTGLANRLVFREEIEARCRTDKPFALLLIDLDRFKQVNDTLGHPVGDDLLEAVADRLRHMTRAGDIVARLGGDEFAILQDGATQTSASETLAARLIDGISEPYVIDGHRIAIGASVGIAHGPQHGATASALFGHADLALYAAKAAGRGTATSFDPRMKEAALAERQLEADLKAALAAEQFELFYQPILCLATNRVISCEALLRWRHPTRGLVPPLDFIPFAEQTGLIVPIGRWALRQACRDALSWPSHVGVAVNLSAVQVLGGDLVSDLSTILTETGFDPRRLELEVTETLLLGDEPVTRETLLAVRALGVRIALDDFGTGYASLGYLRRFPFDKLKIDQMFVRDITDQQASTAIVRAVASLANSLDMVAVAEGVETKAHLARVAAAGCAQVQGYLFSRPVPARDIGTVIATCTVPALDDATWLAAATAA